MTTMYLGTDDLTSKRSLRNGPATKSDIQGLGTGMSQTPFTLHRFSIFGALALYCGIPLSTLYI